MKSVVTVQRIFSRNLCVLGRGGVVRVARAAAATESAGIYDAVLLTGSCGRASRPRARAPSRAAPGGGSAWLRLVLRLSACLASVAAVVALGASRSPRAGALLLRCCYGAARLAVLYLAEVGAPLQLRWRLEVRRRPRPNAALPSLPVARRTRGFPRRRLADAKRRAG